MKVTSAAPRRAREGLHLVGEQLGDLLQEECLRLGGEPVRLDPVVRDLLGEAPDGRHEGEELRRRHLLADVDHSVAAGEAVGVVLDVVPLLLLQPLHLDDDVLLRPVVVLAHDPVDDIAGVGRGQSG